MKTNLLDNLVKKARKIISKKETLTADDFQVLLYPIKENLYNFIFKSMNFSEDANDIYQETILRAFKYRSSYNPQNPFKTWIFTIANNEIKRYFKRHKNLQEKIPIEEHLISNIDIGNEIQTKIQDIYQVAQQLSPQQQRVFFLFYDQQFSIEEIKGITGLKQGNIKFLLHQTREKIKQKLGVTNESTKN